MLSPSFDLEILATQLNAKDLSQVVTAVLNEIQDTERLLPMVGARRRKLGAKNPDTYLAVLCLFIDYLRTPNKKRDSNESLPRPFQELFHRLNKNLD